MRFTGDIMTIYKTNDIKKDLMKVILKNPRITLTNLSKRFKKPSDEIFKILVQIENDYILRGRWHKRK